MESMGWCRSSRGSVDWNPEADARTQKSLCRSSRGSVDWNKSNTMGWNPDKCRSSRGSVDWNTYSKLFVWRINVSLLSWERGLKLKSVLCCTEPLKRRSSRGSVDWNIRNRLEIYVTNRRSSRGSVDWNIQYDYYYCPSIVAPLVGAWIEISNYWEKLNVSRSLLSWERGLKSKNKPSMVAENGRSSRGSVDWNQRIIKHHQAIRVAPLVGAWIEINVNEKTVISDLVAPLVGAWIEIIVRKAL